jgi:predicted MFS family arabinose efflux permease
MTLRQLKGWYYALTACNTIASAYYLNYLFFFLHDRFGFGNRGNLLVAALHGGAYVFAARFGGRFAQARGYLTSLAVGFAGLALCTGVAAFIDRADAQVWMVVPYTSALLLTWPALEALVIEHEPAARVPHMVGLYNLTWSLATALSYFTGGRLYDAIGRGAVFVVPSVMFVALLMAVLWLRPRAARMIPPEVEDGRVAHPDGHATASRVPAHTFLRLAWIANPFAYMAMYTVLAVMPDLARRLGLSPTRAGLFCSVWFFSRVVAFAALWAWTGWHYRFRWMVAAFASIILAFTAILLAPSLAIMVLAQIFFGLSAGLIYYSSLFYAMDVGEEKGEHGGLHEAAIGIGICAGPAVGALSLQMWPGAPRANAMAVGTLLLAGFASMLVTWFQGRRGSRVVQQPPGPAL